MGMDVSSSRQCPYTKHLQAGQSITIVAGAILSLFNWAELLCVQEVPMQGSYHEMVATRKDCPELKKPCGAPHCHQVYAKLKTSFLEDPKESKWDAQRFGSGFG